MGIRSTASRRALVMSAVVATLAVPVRAQEPSIDELKRDVTAMKRQMQQMQEMIQKQQQTIERLSTQQRGALPVPASTPAPAATPEQRQAQEQHDDEIAERVARRLQPTLASLNKTFPSQFNPAIGLIVDTVFSDRDRERANFEFRSAEIGMSANVDPFVRGYAIFNGTPDGVE